MIKTPILIPVKEHSHRCAQKNQELLPYTAAYIRSEGMLDHAIVISDSEQMISQASSLGLKTHLEIRTPRQDELTSCYHYTKEKNIDTFFMCPAPQPFRSAGLMKKMNEVFEKDKKQIDFVTTVSVVQNRSLFIVKKNNEEWSFVTRNKNRRGGDCHKEYMIDGALYLIRTAFLENVLKASDTNAFFWSGNFTCVINSAPFMDIDTVEEMHHFEFLKTYFTKTHFAQMV